MREFSSASFGIRRFTRCLLHPICQRADGARLIYPYDLTGARCGPRDAPITTGELSICDCRLNRKDRKVVKGTARRLAPDDATLCHCSKKSGTRAELVNRATPPRTYCPSGRRIRATRRSSIRTCSSFSPKTSACARFRSFQLGVCLTR